MFSAAPTAEGPSGRQHQWQRPKLKPKGAIPPKESKAFSPESPAPSVAQPSCTRATAWPASTAVGRSADSAPSMGRRV